MQVVKGGNRYSVIKTNSLLRVKSFRTHSIVLNYNSTIFDPEIGLKEMKMTKLDNSFPSTQFRLNGF